MVTEHVAEGLEDSTQNLYSLHPGNPHALDLYLFSSPFLGLVSAIPVFHINLALI